MGYAPINSNVEDIPLHEYSSHPASLYAPPAGPPPDKKPKSYPQNEKEHLVKHWPSQSQRIWAITPLRSFIIVSDIILASTPIMFIALALIAARLDGREVSAYGNHLSEVLLLSPTIFPVIFAALMGRCFRAVGLFLAERGTTLGRLEQLIGCQSLFSALERQISLRSWSIVGFGLVLLWLLSPLGGQSALRLLGQENKSLASKANFQYLNPLAVQDSLMMGASAINEGRSTFTSIFLAALLSSTKYHNSTMDLWGNVKIPSYRSVANSSPDEWKPVPSTNVTYASLIGIPVVKTHNTGQSNFTLKTRQWDVTCDNNQAKGGDDTNFGNATSAWKMSYNGNGTCTSWPCSFKFMSVSGTDESDIGFNFTVATCTMNYEYLEAAINCNGTDCAAVSLRKLELYTDNYETGFDGFLRNGISSNGMKTVVSVDTYSVGSAASRGSTNPEKWMRDPNNFIGASYQHVRLYELSADLLATRLNVIWNTFMHSTYGTLTLGGNLPANLTTLKASAPNLTFNTTSAVLSDPSPPVYKTNWRWFTLLLVSSIILQIAAYTGLVLKYYTCVPDIIGYASSMTLLNPYVPTPTGGTTLHGLERAALLQDIPVRIGDVCADEPVGAIAFAKADEGRVARLDRKRFYI